MQATKKSFTPVAGLIHFLLHHTVSSRAWQALCQAITKAYLKMREHSDTLDVAITPAICEYTGCCLLCYDDGVSELGMIDINSERVTH